MAGQFGDLGARIRGDEFPNCCRGLVLNLEVRVSSEPQQDRLHVQLVACTEYQSSTLAVQRRPTRELSYCSIRIGSGDRTESKRDCETPT